MKASHAAGRPVAFRGGRKGFEVVDQALDARTLGAGTGEPPLGPRGVEDPMTPCPTIVERFGHDYARWANALLATPGATVPRAQGVSDSLSRRVAAESVGPLRDVLA
jgi:hypothetical protein